MTEQQTRTGVEDKLKAAELELRTSQDELHDTKASLTTAETKLEAAELGKEKLEVALADQQQRSAATKTENAQLSAKVESLQIRSQDLDAALVLEKSKTMAADANRITAIAQVDVLQSGFDEDDDEIVKLKANNEWLSNEVARYEKDATESRSREAETLAIFSRTARERQRTLKAQIRLDMHQWTHRSLQVLTERVIHSGLFLTALYQLSPFKLSEGA